VRWGGVGVLAAHKNQILIRRILDISLDDVINSLSSPTRLDRLFSNILTIRTDCAVMTMD
jgi:hypothetical protein